MNNQIKQILGDLKKSNIQATTLTGDDSPCVVKEWLSTGCLVLDAIMGKGLPVGRMTEMFGDPSSGKSLIGAQVAALAQANDIIVGYEDTESAVSKDMMKMLGVDVDNLIYDSADTVEGVFKFFETTLESKIAHAKDQMLLLIWDSVAATSVEQEMANEYGKASMGRHAQIISQSLRKFTRQIARERVCVLFLNQTRQKIGVMFGDDTTTFGGNAIPFHASVRVKLDLSSKIKVDAKKGKKIIGMYTRATVVKSKVSMPFKQVMLPIHFGHGIDDALATYMYLQDNDLIKVAGQSSIIQVNNEEIKFKRKEWPGLFEELYNGISELVFGLNDDMSGELADGEAVKDNTDN